MKIVFNTDQIYLHGGIEKVMATKANYFAALSNVEVFILTTEQKNNTACYSLDTRVQHIDLEVNYNRSKSYFSLENIKNAFKHFFKQRKILKTLQPDVVISPNYNFDHYWLPFIKPKKTKVIKEIHASGYSSAMQRQNKIFASQFKWWLNDKVLANYNCIVVLNEDEKSYQKTNNVVVIPNPITIPKTQAVLANKQVIAAGRIAPVKGFDQLIEAWQLVYQKQPDWQLHLYGDAYSETKEQLQQQIYGCQLESVVLFKDSVSNIPMTMLDYSIYAMSSVTECFPMVLLEALSVGLPIVSYDCPNGPRHIITNKIEGLLVENQDPNALTEGLLQLIENETLRQQFGEKAKENSVRFATETVMVQWLQLFENL